MYYFFFVVVVLPVMMFLSDSHLVHVLDKRYIYMYPLVYVIKLVLTIYGVEFVCICCYISQLPFSAYSS